MASVTISPGSQVVQQGGTATYSVTVNTAPGSKAFKASFSFASGTAGVTGTFTPADHQFSASGRSTSVTVQLTVSAPISAATGTHGFSVSVRDVKNASDAVSATGSFEVPPGKAQNITLAALGELRYAGGAVAVAASTDSDLPLTLTVVSGPGELSNGQLSATGVGTVVVRAEQAGGSGWEPASQTLEIEALKGAQTLRVVQPGDLLVGANPFELDAEATSGLTPEVALLSGPASVNGKTITVLGAGTVELEVRQSGSDLWEEAEPVHVQFDVSRNRQSINFPPLVSALFEQGSAKLGARADSGLPVTYRITSGQGRISGDMLLVGGPGLISVVATQEGSEVFEPAEPVTRVFRVESRKLEGQLDLYWTPKDTALIVDEGGVLANDGVWSTGVSVLTMQPESGSVTLNARGLFVYVPRRGWTGKDTFSYQIWKGSRHSGDITVTIFVGITPYK